MKHKLMARKFKLVRMSVCCNLFWNAEFWDTAGQEKFQSIHASYYHQAHACIFVFDVTRKVTYKNLGRWYEELRQYRPDIPCVCLGNKIDGKRKSSNKYHAS